MRVRLESLGCRLNQAEIEAFGRRLTSAGHHLVGPGEAADLCLLDTCTVTATASRKSRHLLRRLRRENPGAAVVATGCFSEMEQEAARATGLDLIVPNADKDRLFSSLQRAGLLRAPDSVDDDRGFDVVLGRAGSRTRAFVKVQDGCDNHCTYCVVTVARGDARSREIDDVVEEIGRLVTSGHLEVVLTGVHLGSFGHDRGDKKGLQRLVRAVLAETGISRLRLSSLEPWDLADDFFSLWADPRLLPHLHIPLQSGCDDVLRRMGRKTNRARFTALVRTARSAITDAAVSTDIMVGFPGEAEAQFRESLEMVEELAFSKVHVFRFSPRPGTAAAAMADRIPERVATDRSRQMLDLAARMERTFLERHVGRTMAALWESGTQVSTGLRFTGLTDNYLRVVAETDGTVDLRGTVTKTEIEGVANGALQGRVRASVG